MKKSEFTLTDLKAFYPFLNEREQLVFFEFYCENRKPSEIASRHADMFGGIAVTVRFVLNCAVAKIEHSDLGDYLE